LLQSALEQEIWAAAARNNDPEHFPLYAGQSVGVIHSVPGAAEVVAAIAREAAETIRRMTSAG
jgi:hypothetical protein